MFQRRRQDREEKAAGEELERRRRTGRSLPVADVATRRTFIHSVVDPRLVEVDKVPDLEVIRQQDPDLAAALEGIYLVLDGVVTDTEYLHREAPKSRCMLETDLRILIQDLEDKLKKVDNDKISFRFAGKDIPFRFTMIVAVALALGKLYIPTLWNLALVIFRSPEWWPWIGMAGAGVMVLGGGIFVWTRRQRR